MGKHGTNKRSANKADRISSPLSPSSQSKDTIVIEEDQKVANDVMENGHNSQYIPDNLCSPRRKIPLAPRNDGKNPPHRPNLGLNKCKTFYINEILNRILRRYAFERVMKESEVVRWALDEFFTAYAGESNIPDIPNLPQEKKNAPAAPTDAPRPSHRPNLGFNKAKTLYVTEELNNHLRRYAFEHDINESSILRLALRQFFMVHKEDVDLGKDAF